MSATNMTPKEFAKELRKLARQSRTIKNERDTDEFQYWEGRWSAFEQAAQMADKIHYA